MSAILSGEARTGGEPSTSIRTGSAAGGLGYEGKSRFLTVELFGRANVESLVCPGVWPRGLKPRILIGLYGPTEVGPFPRALSACAFRVLVEMGGPGGKGIPRCVSE